MADQIMLKVENVCKSFGPTKASNNVNLELKKGTVLGLAGENGSGKSTLASMICGMQRKDSGKFYKDGQEFDPKNPGDAKKHGVAMVVQELGVVGPLSGAINMFLGEMDKYKKGPLVDLKAMERDAYQQFDQWNLPHVPLDIPAGELQIEQRKLMELARALNSNPDFLVLDEISQALSQDNRNVLYEFIKKFKEDGRTILMITHDLEEMVEICDEIAVLRDGEVVETRPSSDYSMEELKRLMIGREVSGDYYRDDQEESYQKEVILEAKDLNVPGKCEHISFELHKGEILGICGLSDAGIHELGSAMFGLEEGRTGSLVVKSSNTELKKPGDMIRTRGAYLSKDRDAHGLMLDDSVGDNLIVPSVRKLSGALAFLSPIKTRKLAQEASEAFEVKASGLGHIVRRLSGGNKQKVNLSRWLIQDLDYIILDCPTRGVDIGVKAYIYSVLKDAKARGLGIIMISDELAEAMGMSDRILVMKEHRQEAILSRTCDFTEEKIMEAML